MTGPATIKSHVAPSIRTAAEEAGRPAPRIAVGLPVCVTDDPAAARACAAEEFAIYGMLPSYRAMLDKEGAPVRPTLHSWATRLPSGMALKKSPRRAVLTSSPVATAARRKSTAALRC
jgi:alkanesulfonate monooxygenase SsuD/methylene tetrahydromethanopterin reductase-like flavin-dependent oxidoreductase (luciferase family)